MPSRAARSGTAGSEGHSLLAGGTCRRGWCPPPRVLTPFLLGSLSGDSPPHGDLSMLSHPLMFFFFFNQGEPYGVTKVLPVRKQAIPVCEYPPVKSGFQGRCCLDMHSCIYVPGSLMLSPSPSPCRATPFLYFQTEVQ